MLAVSSCSSTSPSDEAVPGVFGERATALTVDRLREQQQALYSLLTSVNRARTLPEIYECALDGICRCQHVARAAILLFDADGVMRFKAQRGLSAEYRAAVEGHSPWKADAVEPEPVVIVDTAVAPLDPALRGALEREGIGALGFFPLSCDGRLLGKFMIYHDRPHPFPEEEIQAAEAIAGQIAFAIERRRAAEVLEAVVDERTASLREAIAQMEEFSYSVSHDLRAPLRAMRGYAEALLEDYGVRLDDDGRLLLARIVRSGTRMDQLIQDLLTYSRLSRREISLEAVTPDRLIAEVVEQYPHMQPEHADITVERPMPAVVAHVPSLTQVVSNLLGNAVKFVAPGVRPQVRVTAERKARHVRVIFADNGIGVPEEYQTRLFGLFERVHPGGDYEGTGIGLAIVRKAVERMNGSVGVESDGHTGSRFWIELPAV